VKLTGQIGAESSVCGCFLLGRSLCTAVALATKEELKELRWLAFAHAAGSCWGYPPKVTSFFHCNREIIIGSPSKHFVKGIKCKPFSWSLLSKHVLPLQPSQNSIHILLRFPQPRILPTHMLHLDPIMQVQQIYRSLHIPILLYISLLPFFLSSLTIRTEPIFMYRDEC